MTSYRTPPQGKKERNLKLALALAADPRFQNEIAFEADLWPDQLTKFKLGYLKPTPAQKEAIAKVLGVEVADLFDNAPESAVS